MCRAKALLTVSDDWLGPPDMEFEVLSQFSLRKPRFAYVSVNRGSQYSPAKFAVA